MLYYKSSKSTTAISFETACFSDLEYCINQEGVELKRIDPLEFLNSPPDHNTQYINLVIKDLDLRKQITEYLDQHNLDRFTFVHPLSTIWTNISSENGIYVGPFINIQTKVILEKDIFIHGLTGIGHKGVIGTGTIICGHTLIGGVAKIGKYCLLNIRTTIYDYVTIPDNTVIGAGSIVRKSIAESGVYATVKTGILKKIK